MRETESPIQSSEDISLSAEETDLSTTADYEATRYFINIHNGEVKTETFENFLDNKYVNKFGNKIKSTIRI